METINMKIALFENQYGRTTGTETYEKFDGYIRVSEYVDVRFPSFSKEDLIRAKVAIIDTELDTLFSRVTELRQRKQELLALEHTK